MLSEQALRAAGLDEFEIVHAMANVDVSYGAEHVVATESGREIRCPAHPAECDYARVTTVIGDDVAEIAYWSTDEFREAPSEVLGALLGAAGGRTAEPGPEPTDDDMSDVYRTTIQVTVLHHAEGPTELAADLQRPLAVILDGIENGETLGTTRLVSTRRVPKAGLRTEQMGLGGDGTFFARQDE